jgi:hypothetical protein
MLLTSWDFINSNSKGFETRKKLKQKFNKFKSASVLCKKRNGKHYKAYNQ